MKGADTLVLLAIPATGGTSSPRETQPVPGETRAFSNPLIRASITSQNRNIPTEMKSILWENTNGKEARCQGTGGFKAPFRDTMKMTAGLNGLGIYSTDLSFVTTQSHVHSGKIPSSD